MIEIRMLPQLEVTDWSHVVRVPLGRVGARTPTVVVALLCLMTATLSAILAFA